MSFHINFPCHLFLTLGLGYHIPFLEVTGLENLLSGQGGGRMWDNLCHQHLFHTLTISPYLRTLLPPPTPMEQSGPLPPLASKNFCIELHERWKDLSMPLPVSVIIPEGTQAAAVGSSPPPERDSSHHLFGYLLSSNTGLMPVVWLISPTTLSNKGS